MLDMNYEKQTSAPVSKMPQDMVAALNKIHGRSEQRNRHSTGRRVGALLIGTGAVMGLTSEGREATSTLVDAGKTVIEAVEDRIENDRMFNPDRGNPANTEEIVGTWDESNPTQSVVVIEPTSSFDK